MTKILVIEDEMTVRANIAELLEEEDFEVITAENGFIGVLWAQEHLPDLVICDVMMPELDGRDVLSALRQDPLTETVPFIFLTARADKSDIRLGMDLGADDYLTKPFSRRELLGAVHSRISKSQRIERQYLQKTSQLETVQKANHSLSETPKSEAENASIPMKNSGQAIPKLKVAIDLLKKLPDGIYRQQCMQLLQEIYNTELTQLKNSSVLTVGDPVEGQEFWQALNQLEPLSVQA